MKEEWRQVWIQIRKALSATLMTLAVKVGPKAPPAEPMTVVLEEFFAEQPVVVEEVIVEESPKMKRKKK